MARTAVLGRLTWRRGRVSGVRHETASAVTVVLDVPGWPSHVPGQHVDVRLTAPDGYTATRSYSIASAPDGTRVEITVERLDDGEVSPYLTGVLAADDELELLGPVGGWFVWPPELTEPVQLIGGGSGVVPLMAMLRTHAAAGSSAPMRLLYSARSPDDALYLDELDEVTKRDAAAVSLWFTRRRRADADGRADGAAAPGRLDATAVGRLTWPPDDQPRVYICGSNSFVETVSRLLVAAGHEPGRVRTERFGPMGGST